MFYPLSTWATLKPVRRKADAKDKGGSGTSVRLPGTRCPQTGYESGDPSRPGLITTLSQAGSSLLLHPRPGRSPPDVAVDRDRGEQKMARSCGIHDRAATGERWFHPSRLAWWCAELSPIGSPVTARPCHATITGRGGCCSSPLTWCCVVCDLVTVFSVWPPFTLARKDTQNFRALFSLTSSDTLRNCPLLGAVNCSPSTKF